MKSSLLSRFIPSRLSSSPSVSPVRLSSWRTGEQHTPPNLPYLRGGVKAFTLVELMIVIAIIWILSASLFPKISGYMARARDTARMSDLRQIRMKIFMYYNDTGNYPICPGLVFIDGSNDCLSQALSSTLPTDPLKQEHIWGKEYNYWFYSWSPTFGLRSRLEWQWYTITNDYPDGTLTCDPWYPKSWYGNPDGGDMIYRGYGPAGCNGYSFHVSPKMGSY